MNHLILCCTRLPCFLPRTKGSNFCDFLFVSFDDKTLRKWGLILTPLHLEKPKLHAILASLSAIGLKGSKCFLLGEQILSFKS